MAAGLVPLATGGDGAGSVRIPAAWCGVVGLKVTGGRLPSADRTGLAAPGVLTRTAADAAAWWRTVSGRPTAARACPPLPVPAVWSTDLGFAGPDAEPVALARAAAGRLADAGLVRLVRPSSPPELLDPAPAWLALRTPGAATVSPDGSTAVVAVTRLDLVADEYRSQLWAVPTDASAPARPLTHGHRDSAPVFSPDGQWLAFLGAESGGTPQLHLLPTAGGEARRLRRS